MYNDILLEGYRGKLRFMEMHRWGIKLLSVLIKIISVRMITEN